jgi:hypothetical protein
MVKHSVMAHGDASAASSVTHRAAMDVEYFTLI